MRFLITRAGLEIFDGNQTVDVDYVNLAEMRDQALIAMRNYEVLHRMDMSCCHCHDRDCSCSCQTCAYHSNVLAGRLDV